MHEEVPTLFDIGLDERGRIVRLEVERGTITDLVVDVIKTPKGI